VLDAINESGARIRLSGANSRKVIQLKKALAEAQTIYDNVEDCLEYASDYCNISKKDAINKLPSEEIFTFEWSAEFID
jgi:hypothetical protein